MSNFFPNLPDENDKILCYVVIDDKKIPLSTACADWRVSHVSCKLAKLLGALKQEYEFQDEEQNATRRKEVEELKNSVSRSLAESVHEYMTMECNTTSPEGLAIAEHLEKQANILKSRLMGLRHKYYHQNCGCCTSDEDVQK